MIIDTFMFNDEFDMLDIRLALTESYVDKWIILEGNKTWSGIPKSFKLRENFKKYQDKYGSRIHLISLDIPEGYKDWKCENYSRASLQLGIKLCDANDIRIHSELDEILNPEYVPSILELLEKENKPVACDLDIFFYKFDQKAARTWSGNVIAKKHMFQDPQQLYKGDQPKKKNRNHCVRHPGIVGYHWTWMGDDERIKTKVISNIELQYRNPAEVLSALKEQDTKKAINHKCETTFVNYNYPESVLTVIKQYPYWTV
jgi:beta-1,4-mannosyl-glycoprotein beta-1,4-N-acetylglucosaminyltransferase